MYNVFIIKNKTKTKGDKKIMLSDDKIKVMDINGEVDDLRLELLQFGEADYSEEELDEKIDILQQVLDLLGSYLEI